MISYWGLVPWNRLILHPGTKATWALSDNKLTLLTRRCYSSRTRLPPGNWKGRKEINRQKNTQNQENLKKRILQKKTCNYYNNNFKKNTPTFQPEGAPTTALCVPLRCYENSHTLQSWPREPHSGGTSHSGGLPPQPPSLLTLNAQRKNSPKGSSWCFRRVCSSFCCADGDH